MVAAPITFAMQQDDFEHLQVPKSHESLFSGGTLSNQTEQTKVSISLLSLSDTCCYKSKDSVCTTETQTLLARVLADDDSELELDLARLIQRCEGDMTLAVSVLGAFIVQGAACCSEIQQLLEAGRKSQLQFRAVRD